MKLFLFYTEQCFCRGRAACAFAGDFKNYNGDWQEDRKCDDFWFIKGVKNARATARAYLADAMKDLGRNWSYKLAIAKAIIEETGPMRVGGHLISDVESVYDFRPDYERVPTINALRR